MIRHHNRFCPSASYIDFNLIPFLQAAIQERQPYGPHAFLIRNLGIESDAMKFPEGHHGAAGNISHGLIVFENPATVSGNSLIQQSYRLNQAGKMVRAVIITIQDISQGLKLFF